MKKERKRYLYPKIGVFENKLKAKILFLATSFGGIKILCIFALIIKELIWKH